MMSMNWLRAGLGASVLVVGALAAVQGVAAPAPTFNDPAEVAAITALEIDLGSETDFPKVAHYFAPDAFVFDIMKPGVYRGRDQLTKAFVAQFAAVKTFRVKFMEINVATDGALACAALRLDYDMDMVDGSHMAMNARELDGLKKIDGKWQIVEQQLSVPANAASGMGVLIDKAPERGAMDWSDLPPPGPAIGPEQAKDEIRQWAMTSATETDPARRAALYAPGNGVLVFDDFHPGELRGTDELHDYEASRLSSIGSISMTMPIFLAESDGVLGFQIDSQVIHQAMKDGTTKSLIVRQSDCLRRVGGQWTSIMEAKSFPIDFKTGKVDFESETATK
jgi:ketosteroid isomerase-like protein